MTLGQTIGYPGEWRRFARANRERLESLRNLYAIAPKIFVGPRKTEIVADRVIFFLGCLCWEDFNEAVLLCGNGHGVGAAKILRSLYEHAVTAQYISKRPGEAEVFECYVYVQEHNMLEHARRQFDVAALFSDERRAGIERDFEDVKQAYRGSWSKKDLLTMAKETGEGLEQFYLQCYFDPTVHAHATPMAIASRVVIESGNTVFVAGPQRERATGVMFFAHLVMLFAMRTQNEHFKLRLDAELSRHAREFSAVWRDYGTADSR